MNTTQAVCNYALLQFLPYPETGEFVNVGVLVACMQPCLLHFTSEKTMPERVKAMFPRQDLQCYADAMTALRTDMERVTSTVRDPKTCQLIFGELVRRRESEFRFGEVRTILTNDPQCMVHELFRRYVLMEIAYPPMPTLVTA
ncbi:MAG: Protein of unknown function (DUF3037) [Verrucomicrobia bacterium]|nr:MAG: Protein of unknown function (DUF3037) [Verrucomicrobiota bacterium]